MGLNSWRLEWYMYKKYTHTHSKETCMCVCVYVYPLPRTVSRSYADWLSLQADWMIKSFPVHFKLCEEKGISGKQKSDWSMWVPYSEVADNMERDPSIYHINNCGVALTFVRGLGVKVQDISRTMRVRVSPWQFFLTYCSRIIFAY